MATIRMSHHNRPGTAALHYAGHCLFCAVRVDDGAYWAGAGGEVILCWHCVIQGKLGKLLADAAHNVSDLASIQVSTARMAWETLARAQERDAGPVF